MIPSCFCGGCLTCAMHQEALALLAWPHDLAKAVVPCTQRWIGGEPQGPGGFEGLAAAFFRSCRESSTWCELFVAATREESPTSGQGARLPVGVWARLGD